MSKPVHVAIIALIVVTPALADDVVYRVRDEALHSIDSRLFGQFMERPSWGEIGPEGALVPGSNTLQPEVYRLLHRMRVPVMRFPGGTDVDYMDWRDMISNVPGRGAERPVSTGHRGHRVTNNFGYDEFLRLCEQLGSVPIIVVNFGEALLGEKQLSEAALQAAGLVAYCNAGVDAKLPDGMPRWPSVRAANGHPGPYGVKYWQIGNETWAFFSKLKKDHPQEAEKRYADCLVAFARAMLAVDPGIEFIVDGHGPTFRATQIARKELGETIRYTVFHLYKPWAMREIEKEGKPIPIEALSASDIWKAWVAVPHFDEEGLSVVRHPLLAEARREGYKLAVTEWNWNGWWTVQPAALNSSFAKGVGAAGILHALMRSADVIEIGCQSMLVGNSWGIHAIWADRHGKIPPHYMPTGQVTMLYSQHHGSERLDVEAAGIPTYSQPFRMGGIGPARKVAYLDALATAGEDNVFFHVINRHFDQPIEAAIDVTALQPLRKKATHYMLEGRLNDEPAAGESRQIARITHSGVSYDGMVLKVLLPARTVSCIELYRLKRGRAEPKSSAVGREPQANDGARSRETTPIPERAESWRDASEWPQLRGPRGRGHATAKDLPIRWSETENIRWKTSIPGRGYSSPVITGTQLWMTTALEDGRSLCAVCVDADSGEIVYQIELFRVKEPGRVHPRNSYATPTPVVDVEHIYVHFGAEGTAALSKDGSVMWKNSSLAHNQPYAGASSPVVFRNVLIVNCDGMDHQFVVALDKRSGKTVWKTPRAHLEGARKSPMASRYSDEGFTLMGYATPAVIEVNGIPELVSSAAEHVAAYDATNGKELWWLGYRGFSPVGIPIYAHGLVFVQGFQGVGRPALFAIRPGGRGDISETQLAWKETKAVPHVPSPLVVGDELYLVDDDGIMSCLDARTGAKHWKQRLGDQHSASPILADGRIYVCSEKGKTSVLSPGREFKLLAENRLDGRLMATPCASGQALFLRTHTHLYRIERCGAK